MNNNNENLPPNFDLVPFDDDGDADLLAYINANPIDTVPTTTSPALPQLNNTTMMNSMSTSMPVIPRMYFPNSNVTINYNFSK